MMNYPKLPGLTPDGRIYANEDMGTLEAFLPTGGYPTAHAPALLELADGTLLCAWFGGTYEGSADIRIICSRLEPESGRWTEPVDISGDPNRSEQNPSLFNGPDGAVWAVYTAQLDRQAGKDNMQFTSQIRCQKSTDGGLTFLLIRWMERGEGFMGEENKTNNRQYEYPYLMQSRDGMLHLAYAAYTRKGVKYMRFSEADVMGSKRVGLTVIKGFFQGSILIYSYNIGARRGGSVRVGGRGVLSEVGGGREKRECVISAHSLFRFTLQKMAAGRPYFTPTSDTPSSPRSFRGR